MITATLSPSKIKGKKYTAVFYENGKEIKRTHFGASGMSDFTIHKDIERRERYLKRHSKSENWNDKFSAGALSRWVLWNKPSLRASWTDYKRRFGL